MTLKEWLEQITNEDECVDISIRDKNGKEIIADYTPVRFLKKEYPEYMDAEVIEGHKMSVKECGVDDSWTVDVVVKSKELSPLEATKKLVDIAYDKVRSGWENKKLEQHILDLGNIIEAELKKTFVLSNQLEHERKIRIRQEKKLKALEIIVKKEVNIINFKKLVIDKEWSYDDYLNTMTNVNTEIILTQEEFDLIKEVVKEYENCN